MLLFVLLFPLLAIHDIMELVDKDHYQLACTKYFEYTHKQPPEQIINHPNYYFEQSQTILSGKVIKKENCSKFIIQDWILRKKRFRRILRLGFVKLD